MFNIFKKTLPVQQPVKSNALILIEALLDSMNYKPSTYGYEFIDQVFKEGCLSSTEEACLLVSDMTFIQVTTEMLNSIRPGTEEQALDLNLYSLDDMSWPNWPAKIYAVRDSAEQWYKAHLISKSVLNDIIYSTDSFFRCGQYKVNRQLQIVNDHLIKQQIDHNRYLLLE
jgi:hypothetical protein